MGYADILDLLCCKNYGVDVTGGLTVLTYTAAAEVCWVKHFVIVTSAVTKTFICNNEKYWGVESAVPRSSFIARGGDLCGVEPEHPEQKPDTRTVFGQFVPFVLNYESVIFHLEVLF